jgi:hypothetical protein
MINGIKSNDSLFSSLYSNPLSSLTGAAAFGSVFDQAMAQATTPGQKAEVLWAQAKFQNQMTLANMFSDPHDHISSFGLGDLFGTGGPLATPSWVYDAQRLMGDNEVVQQAVNLTQQFKFLAQSQFSHSLANLGLGGGVDSLV